MNIREAKKIPLTELLETLGHTVQKIEQGGRELKFLSPFRNEGKGSLNINTVKNLWFDFGEAEGGNTLDFAVFYLRSRGMSARIPDALAWLEEKLPSFSGVKRLTNSFSQHAHKLKSFEIDHTPEADRSLKFVRASPLNHRRTLAYLKNERNIDPVLARKYLLLIEYINLKKTRAGETPFYSFGLKNVSDGYEIRSASDNPAFKSALIARDITVIKGSGKYWAVNVFEGMLDFISLLQLAGKTEPTADALILHSASSFNRALEYIVQNRYPEIFTWLDNDNTGRKFTDQFNELLPGLVTPRNDIFSPYQDLNEALKAGPDFLLPDLTDMVV